MSDRDKERMRRLGEDLKRIETDEPATPEQAAADIAWLERRINRVVPEERYPEEGILERARALGMARSDRGRS